jgi:hypothetical protein
MNKKFLKSRRNAMFKFKSIIEKSAKDYSIIHNKNDLQEAYNIYMHFVSSNENTVTWYREVAHICRKCGLKVEESTCDSFKIGYYYYN